MTLEPISLGIIIDGSRGVIKYNFCESNHFNLAGHRISKDYHDIPVAIGEQPQWGADLVRIIQAVDNVVERLYVSMPK